MDEVRELVSVTPAYVLVVIMFVLHGSAGGAIAQSKQENGKVSPVAIIMGLVFLTIPWFYILVVLAGRVFGQEWY